MPYNNANFIKRVAVSFDLQGKAWLMFNHERLKFNIWKKPEPTYCHKDPLNFKKRLKLHGVLKKETKFLENLIGTLLISIGKLKPTIGMITYRNTCALDSKGKIAYKLI